VRALRIGEEICAPGGVRLGTLQRLVVDERAHALTHLIVNDRVVGVNHFQARPDGRLTCDLGRTEVATMPALEHATLTGPPPHWQAPRGYSLNDFLRIAGALFGQGPYVPPVDLEPDISAIHEITAGSPVWFGKEHLGEVAAVLAEDDRLSHLVVRRGHFSEGRLVPVDKVAEVIGNNVHLKLNQRELESLPLYKA
jgi:hypothetical protein